MFSNIVNQKKWNRYNKGLCPNCGKERYEACICKVRKRRSRGLPEGLRRGYGRREKPTVMTRVNEFRNKFVEPTLSGPSQWRRDHMSDDKLIRKAIGE